MTGSGHPFRIAAAAEVMVELGDEIEALGALLCSDPDFAARHMRELQTIDLIAQTQRSLARLMAAGLTDCAVDAIGIDALRCRLGAARAQTAGCKAGES